MKDLRLRDEPSRDGKEMVSGRDIFGVEFAKKKTGRVFDSLGALYAREPGLAGPADDAKVSRHVLGRRAGG
jgi:hypothetical protein